MAAPIILCDTAGMTNEQWLEARMHGPHGKIPYTVGGSDVAAIFGVSPWTTPLELWNIKKGRMKPPKKANANQLEMGHLLEPIAAHWYAKKTGNIVKVDTNLYQHADHSYALANFDRRFTRASDGEPGILECKSCTFHKAEEWADGAIPLYYELQLRFYLAVADVEIGSFSAIWGNNPDNDLAILTGEIQLRPQRTIERFDAGYLYPCSIANQHVFITSDLKMQGCVRASYKKFDLRKGTFDEGWKYLQKEFVDKKSSANYKCNSCSNIRFCEHCVANFMLAYGDEEKIDPFFCRVAELRRNFVEAEMKRIIKNEQ